MQTDTNQPGWNEAVQKSQVESFFEFPFFFLSLFNDLFSLLLVDAAAAAAAVTKKIYRSLHERKKGREQENKKPPKTCASGAVIRRIVCNRTAVAMQARRQAGSAVLSFVRSFARSR